MINARRPEGRPAAGSMVVKKTGMLQKNLIMSDFNSKFHCLGVCPGQFMSVIPEQKQHKTAGIRQ
jgi:hypothetical protein